MRSRIGKVLLPAAALALVAFVACGGDDSGSGAPAVQGRAAGGGAAAPSGGASAVTVTIPNQGGALEGHTPRGFRGSGKGLFAGDNLNPGFPDGDGVQAFITFDLADVPRGQVVAAILRSSHLGTQGSPFRDLGPLAAEEIRYDAFSPDLWNLPPLSGGAGCILATTASSRVECGVRDAVQRSLDDGYGAAQFRLRMDKAGDSDGSPDLVMFFLSGTNRNEPGIFELEVTVKPMAGGASPDASAPDDPGLLSGLVAYFPFDGDALDASGNGNNGRPIGTESTADQAGHRAGAIAFNGIDDVITVPHSNSLDLSREVTMSYWILYEPQATGDFYTVFEKSDPGDGHARYGSWLLSERVEVCADPSNGGAQRCVDSSEQLKPGTWNHVVGRYDGESLDITLNGRPAGRKTFRASGISRNTAPLFIGADLFNPGKVFTKGSLDELRIYDRALSDDEIRQLFEMGSR